MHGLRHEHSKVMDRLNAIKQREQLSLQDQEKDLLRAFRARLWDVQFELEAERSKKDDGALEWIARPLVDTWRCPARMQCQKGLKKLYHLDRLYTCLLQ